MKTILFLALLALSTTNARAGTVTLSMDESYNLMEDLLFAGVQPDRSTPIYKFELRNLHCHVFYGGAGPGDGKDDAFFGMPDYLCRNPEIKDAGAKLVYNAMDTLITKHNDQLELGDCLHSTCFEDLARVSCTIDSTQVENTHRYACEVSDGK